MLLATRVSRTAVSASTIIQQRCYSAASSALLVSSSSSSCAHRWFSSAAHAATRESTSSSASAWNPVPSVPSSYAAQPNYSAAKLTFAQQPIITSLASASSSTVVPPSACQSLDDVDEWIQFVYNQQLLERINAQQQNNQQHPPYSLLHVTSLFHPRPYRSSTAAPLPQFASHGIRLPTAAPASSSSSSSNSRDGEMYTLRVGLGMPSHKFDRFALNLTRALAHTVLYSGRVLREEPGLRCVYDQAFDAGLTALRTRANAPTRYPHLAILTRGRGEPLDFTHVIFDDSSEQECTIYYADPQYGVHVRRGVEEHVVEEQTTRIAASVTSATAAASTTNSERQLMSFSIPLGVLASAALAEDRLITQKDVQLATGQPLSSASQRRTITHPNKLIHFRCIEGMDISSVCDMIRPMNVTPFAASHPFLSHISVEAGPTSTAHLYRDAPVQSLFLSVYRGAIPSQHYRRYLVFPSDLKQYDRPPPTLIHEFIERNYTCRSKHQSEKEPEWTFYWYERKTRAGSV